jgi:hypothetical protein
MLDFVQQDYLCDSFFIETSGPIRLFFSMIAGQWLVEIVRSFLWLRKNRDVFRVRGFALTMKRARRVAVSSGVGPRRRVVYGAEIGPSSPAENTRIENGVPRPWRLLCSRLRRRVCVLPASRHVVFTGAQRKRLDASLVGIGALTWQRMLLALDNRGGKKVLHLRTKNLETKT